ncbi:MAG: copper resistance protein CopC [Dehalococcoidia bacterium]
MGVVTIAAFAALAIPASVSGHADYESSTPARDEVVQTAPPQVDVFFTQEVFRQEGANYVRVFNDSGDQVSEGDGVIDDDDRTHISTDLPADMPAGRYIVQWQTLSDTDGDDDTGAFCFYVQTEPTQPQRDECAAFAGEEGETPAATGGATEAAPTTEATVPAIEPTSTPVVSTGSDDDSGVSSAVIIAGIIVGGVVILAIVGGAFILLRRTLE